MKKAARDILTINGGSSSIKFAVFEPHASLRRKLVGRIERIGLPGATLTLQGSHEAEGYSRGVAAADQTAAVARMFEVLESRESGGIAAVGHRVVHGGPTYSEAQQVTPEMLQALRDISAFDPQHLPVQILLMEAVKRRYPDLPQIACFDTAFHRDLPRVARLLPIPRRYEALGVRRYGFHGLSYAFLMEELARVAGDEAASGRVVLAHLGNGASLAAVHQGRSIDTTMAFTPTSGVPMSTRAGDLDPGLVAYLASTENMDARAFSDMVNFESGLLGLSELSPDMQDLLEREANDVRAAEAVAVFCYQIRKCIGSFAAALGGIDALVFTGGIGERAAIVRARICQGLDFLGIELDRQRNAAGADVISSDCARVAVRVMQTDEESTIARTVCRVVGLDVC